MTGRTLDRVKLAIGTGEYVLSVHAAERLRERRIMEWQVAAGVDAARLLEDRPDDTPNPTVVVEQHLPDGTPVRVVWAWLPRSGLARLVTVHFLDR